MSLLSGKWRGARKHGRSRLLSQIGKAELMAKAPKKHIQPEPADGDGPA